MNRSRSHGAKGSRIVTNLDFDNPDFRRRIDELELAIVEKRLPDELTILQIIGIVRICAREVSTLRARIPEADRATRDLRDEVSRWQERYDKLKLRYDALAQSMGVE